MELRGVSMLQLLGLHGVGIGLGEADAIEVDPF